MAHVTDSLRTGTKYDARRKITDEDKQEIKELYRQNTNIREIARKLSHISRRSIQFILFPERLAHLKKHNIEIEHHKKYYKKDYHKLAMRRHRARKRLLQKQGKINTAVGI